MPNKPDRFDRIANRVTNRYIGTYIGGPEHAREIAKLLRAEHAWMRRMVRQEPELTGAMPLELYVKIQRSSIIQVEEILRCVVRATKKSMLAKLDQRRK